MKLKPSEFNRKILEIVSQGKETGEELSILETAVVQGKKKVFLNIISLGRSQKSRKIGEPFLVSFVESERGDIFSFSKEQIEIITKTMINNKIGCSSLIKRGIGIDYDSTFLDILRQWQ